jgi:hypothetical protein
MRPEVCTREVGDETARDERGKRNVRYGLHHIGENAVILFLVL